MVLAKCVQWARDGVVEGLFRLSGQRWLGPVAGVVLASVLALAAVGFGVWATVTRNPAVFGRQTALAGVYSLVLAAIIAAAGMFAWVRRARGTQSPSTDADEISALRAVAPELLPRDVSDFTDRDDELARLKGLASGGGSVVVTAINGTAGVGKTALALHAAHKLRATFPDGNLYADMRGYAQGQQPADPREVLPVFLRALRVPEKDLPTDLEEQSGMFRQLLSSRRMLVFLDNVRTEKQVERLLPGTGSSLVLITSRERLAGLELERDKSIHLDILPAEEAIELLTKLIGQERAGEEPDAVRDVSCSCGRLPLALRIAGQILVERPSWDVERLAKLLADKGRLLDELAVGDKQVRSAIAVSYDLLCAADARMFRLLGLLLGPYFDSSAAGILADLEPDAADEVLQRLALANLISSDRDGRFRVYDLVQRFAQEQAEADLDAARREQARDRLFRYYLCKAGLADKRLRALPDVAGPAEFDNRDRALAWLDAERPNLVTAVTMAAASDRCEVAADLTVALGQYFYSRRLLDDWLYILGTGLKAARQLGDPRREGKALTHRGWALFEVSRFDEGVNECQNAVAIFRELGDGKGKAEALNNLGLNLRAVNRLEEANTAYREAVDIFPHIPDPFGEGHAMTNLGRVLGDLGQFDEAITQGQNAVTIFQRLRDWHEVGGALINLGSTLQRAGKPKEAVIKYREAETAYGKAGDSYGVGQVLGILGKAYQELRQANQAITCLWEAFEIYRQVGYRRGEGQALSSLGDVYRVLGQFDKMKTCQAAAQIIREGRDDNLTELLEGLKGSVSKPRWSWRRKKTSSKRF